MQVGSCVFLLYSRNARESWVVWCAVLFVITVFLSTMTKKTRATIDIEMSQKYLMPMLSCTSMYDMIWYVGSAGKLLIISIKIDKHTITTVCIRGEAPNIQCDIHTRLSVPWYLSILSRNKAREVKAAEPGAEYKWGRQKKKRVQV